MGTRYITYYDCPECRAKDSVEEYDAASCVMFVAICEKCGWKDPRDYYQEIVQIAYDEWKKMNDICDNDFPEHYTNYHLITKDEAKIAGFCLECGCKPCQCSTMSGD